MADLGTIVISFFITSLVAGFDWQEVNEIKGKSAFMQFTLLPIFMLRIISGIY